MKLLIKRNIPAILLFLLVLASFGIRILINNSDHDSGYKLNFYDDSKIPNIENNTIFAGNIDLSAPILWDIKNTPNETQENLKKGVIHLQGTAKPGNKGNIFITGHSSDYTASGGNYKDVFSLLEKLKKGNKIFIKYEDHMYGYKIISSKIVKPNNLSVLDQGDDYLLSIATCVPVGTDRDRLIIISEQFYYSK